MKYSKFLTALALSSLVPIAGVKAQGTPVEERTLELGIGVGASTSPDYRGSKSYRSYVSPIPYLVYRGSFLRADEDGVRAMFFRRDNLEVNISLSASFTPDSDENELRRGMPELDSTLELGPAVNINLSGSDLDEGWMLTLPVRAVMAVDIDRIDHIGWLAEPQALYQDRWQDWKLSFRVGPSFADNQYHDYYYRVTQGQALADRPAYDASGGYGGMRSQATATRRAGEFWYGVYVRYYNLKGSSFLDSPLVETHQGVDAGLGISWIFY